MMIKFQVMLLLKNTELTDKEQVCLLILLFASTT